MAAAADHAPRAAGRVGAADRAAADRGDTARAGRLRGVVRVSKGKAGERLPYLLGQLKAPRVLERLEQTAALAREQEWPYERFLETLLEAEVFARDASGARMRIRHAGFPALKTLEDFDWSAALGGGLLFALVSRRYERGSIIVTSNRGFEQWREILGDAMVAAA